jgi:hypothetical protein
MKMKKTILVLVLLAAVVGGCRYKEGPLISFRSAKSRLIGDWKVTGFSVDGNDELQLFNDSCGCKMYIPDESDYQEIRFFECKNYLTGINSLIAGSYSFSNNHKILKIYFDNLNDVIFKRYGPFIRTSDWKILRLTKDDFKISTDVDNKNYVVTFAKTN